jgi:hypothetical protein
MILNSTGLAYDQPPSSQEQIPAAAWDICSVMPFGTAKSVAQSSYLLRAITAFKSITQLRSDF